MNSKTKCILTKEEKMYVMYHTNNRSSVEVSPDPMHHNIGKKCILVDEPSSSELSSEEADVPPKMH